MLYYENYRINTKKSLALVFKRYGHLSCKKFSGDLKLLNSILGLPEKYSFNFIVKIVNQYYKNSDNKIFRYLNKCGEENFSLKRYEKYKDYRKINNKDTFSETYHKLIYGRYWKKYFNQSRIRNSPLDPKYVSERDGVSSEEAAEKVKKLKEAYKTSKENFILKYGKKVGIQKYNEFVFKVSNNSIFNLNYWINMGFAKAKAKQMRAEFFKNNSSINSVEFWQKRGLSASQAKSKVKEICIKRGVSFMSASKQSLTYFNSINEKLLTLGFKPRFGVPNNSEFSIWDNERKKLCFYDFTVPELKVIIEFNGDKFHPNPNKLSKSEWDSWRVPYTDRIYTADEIAEKDRQKMNLAIRNGFDFLVIWSSDPYSENMEKIRKIFNKYKIDL